MSVDSLMYRDIHVISEESVNRVETVPVPIADIPVVILEESEPEEYYSEEDYSEETMGIASYLNMMIDVEDDMEVTSINTVMRALESTPTETMGAMYLSVLDRNVQLHNMVQHQKEEISDLYGAKESAKSDYEIEHDEKVLMTDKARDYKNEVVELRKKLVEKDRR